MRVLAVVEINAGPGGLPPLEFVTAAYRASRAGLVLLVLNGVEPAALDHALDGVVRDTSTAVHGVLYASLPADDVRGADAPLAAAAGARVVVAESDAFRARLAERDVRWTDGANGLSLLAALAGAAPRQAPTAAPVRAHLASGLRPARSL